MQNIADNFLNTYSSRCYKDVEGMVLVGLNCDFSCPSCIIIWLTLWLYIMQVEGNDKYVGFGPPFLIFFHPALGPLWEVTR